MKFEKEDLTDQIRAKQPGKIVQLSHGNTYFELIGSPSKELVVLVHGFSMPSSIWTPLFSYLSENGYYVLRYDLYGRGFSDRPKVKYDEKLFVKQLYELIHALKLEKIPFSLMGLSMGGPICIHFIDTHPNLVKKLILSDPAGFPFSALPFIMKIPGLNKLLFKKIGPKLLLKKIHAGFNDQVDISEIYESFQEQMKYRGFLNAIFSTMFHFPMNTSREAFQRVGQVPIPKLLLWGEDDKTVPFSLHSQVISALPGIEFSAFPNVAHIPHFENPKEVNPVILAFLQKCE